MIASGVLAVWAYLLHRRGLGLSRAYWHALRGTAALLVIQIVLGVAFLLDGLRPKDGLHLMYAGLVTLGVGAEEMLRPTSSLGRMLREPGDFRESLTYALITAVVALLTLRLWMTG